MRPLRCGERSLRGSYRITADSDRSFDEKLEGLLELDVTVTYADGEENLGDVVARTGSDRFASVDELESEIYGVLPREAVGEPYQSEGEG